MRYKEPTLREELEETQEAFNIHIGATNPHSMGNCSIDTGTYTGDGTNDWSNGITVGSGVRPLVVYVYMDDAADNTSGFGDFLIDLGNKRALQHTFGANYHYLKDNRIRTSATGFEVSDDGIDANPNKNGQDYVWMALW